MSADVAAGPNRTPPRSSRPWFRSSFSLVRVAGIDIRVHVTFFLLVLLFAAASSGPGGPGVVGGLLWLAAIFSCVVVHELAHSVVARRRGAVVHEIVLLPIGGVSKLENLPETPADEFAIAAVGPAASFALAAVAAVLCVLLRQPLFPVDFAGGPFLARLAWLNLILGGFNLLPAFPLDGGRVLRSMLERRYDLEGATHRAARIGRVLALTMMAVGLFVDFWLLLIGIFVYFGASAEETATTIHVRLKGRSVADVMLRDPLVLDPRTGLDELQGLVQRTAQRAFPVVGPDGYLGLLRLDRIPPGATHVRVGDLVDRSTPTVTPAARLEDDVVPLLVRSPARALAVLENGHIVGLVCVEDVEHLVADRR